MDHFKLRLLYVALIGDSKALSTDIFYNGKRNNFQKLIRFKSVGISLFKTDLPTIILLAVHYFHSHMVDPHE